MGGARSLQARRRARPTGHVAILGLRPDETSKAREQAPRLQTHRQDHLYVRENCCQLAEYGSRRRIIISFGAEPFLTTLVVAAVAWIET
jgi:hypothetical protein